jgi:hypothetical protein
MTIVNYNSNLGRGFARTCRPMYVTPVMRAISVMHRLWVEPSRRSPTYSKWHSRWSHFMITEFKDVQTASVLLVHMLNSHKCSEITQVTLLSTRATSMQIPVRSRKQQLSSCIHYYKIYDMFWFVTNHGIMIIKLKVLTSTIWLQTLCYHYFSDMTVQSNITANVWHI